MSTAQVSPARQARWQAHRDGRRADVIRSGLDVIDRGVVNPATEEIAAAAGVNRQALYRYFVDADDLRRSIAENIATGLLDVFAAALSRGGPRETVSALLDGYLDYVESYPHRLPFLRRTGLPSRGRSDGFEAAIAARALAQVGGPLPGLSEQNLEPMARQVIGLVRRATVWWLGVDGMSRAQFTEILNLLVWSLAMPGLPMVSLDAVPEVRPRGQHGTDGASAEPVVRAVDGRRERWSGHRATRYAKLVDAGIATVERLGADATAEDIALSAGVGRTVLYRYFRDKEDLRVAVARRAVDMLEHEIVEVAAAAETSRALIDGLVTRSFGWAAEHPQLYAFLRARSPVGTHPIEEVEDVAATRVARSIADALGALGAPSGLAEATAFGAIGVLESAVAWWFLARPMPLEEMVDATDKAIWNVIEGALRASGVSIDLDGPISLAGLA